MRLPDGLVVEGPVQAELSVVWIHEDRLEPTRPCAAAPWLIELAETDHPVDGGARVVRDVVGEPLLVHSTSWRRDRSTLMLSFLVVIDDAQVGSTRGSGPVGCCVSVSSRESPALRRR